MSQFTESTTPADNPEYALAHYISDEGEYVVIVSPKFLPEAFCKPGYIVTHTAVLFGASNFPIDVILRPDHKYPGTDTEPDEGPLVELFENASRLGEDGWLESFLEDRISGWGE